MEVVYKQTIVKVPLEEIKLLIERKLNLEFEAVRLSHHGATCIVKNGM